MEGSPPGIRLIDLINKDATNPFNGKQVWDSYLETRRDIMNIYTPKWNSKLACDGEIPSCKTREDLLNEILDELWQEKEQARVAKWLQRNPAPDGEEENEDPRGHVQSRPEGWEPLSWLAFVNLGVGSVEPGGNGASRAQ
mmetsp:Transcript_18337/g.37183  ORF Transcript_18337/g.37183 Transcript_18337/m.37183 type:complete len:140 (+) Transcript_18337:1097-1516(+)